MGEHVQCPRCEQAYALSDEQVLLYAGREFECPQCTTRFIVPPHRKGASATSPVRGELPREQLTAAAARAPAFGYAYTSYAPFNAYAAPQLESTPGSSLAAASLICGVIGFLIPVVPGVVAILLGLAALYRIRRARVDGASLAMAGILTGAAGMFLSSVLVYQRVLPFVDQLRRGGSASELRCPDNFRKIDSALTRFAADHDGHFPDGLDAMVAEGMLDADALICPATGDTKAVGKNAAEIAQHIRAGGHCSYVYTGKGLTTQSPSECVLIYEPLAAHHQDGISVLFVDGRIQNIGHVEASKALGRLASGQNPPWSN